MKTMYKIYVLVLLFFFLASLASVSAKDDYTKTINKQFTVKNGDKLIVDNRFGKVHCNNWDKDEVSLQVNITVSAHNEEEAGRYFNRINIDISQSGGVINAKTTLSDRNSSGDFSIDYEINMPSYLDLNIMNKFGDIFVNEIAGKSSFDLAYGNLDVNKLLNSDNLVQIKFGNARIGWIKGAVITAAYSKLDVEYAGSMRLNSKFSDLDAGQIISLNSDIQGGNITVTSSSILDCRSKFSDIKISKVDKSVTLSTQYGDCSIDEITAEFSTIDVKNHFGQVSLKISDNASYTITASLQFCDLDYPRKKAKLSEVDISPTSKSYKGTVGQDQSPKSTVTIDSEYGGVSLE